MTFKNVQPSKPNLSSFFITAKPCDKYQGCGVKRAVPTPDEKED